MMGNYMILRFFTSLKLTLTLLLGLSFVSIFGTLGKVEDNRFDYFYQSTGYRILLLLLALNIAACTWKTCKRNLDDKKRFRERLHEEAEKTSNGADFEALERELQKTFRVERRTNGLLASRGRLGRWGSTIVHVSLLIIMLGGILAEFGFVGTQMVPEGKSTITYFNWDVGLDRPLGFEFRVDHFELDYYPIELKIGAYDPQTRELIEEYVTQEGEMIELPLQGVTARIVNFEPFDKALSLDIFREGQKIGSYRGLPGASKEEVTNFLDEFLVIKPTAFRDPVVRQIIADASILENGEVVKQQRIMVNHPLVYKGVAFYQTAYNQDEFGFWYVGFQISKDPGEPLVWAGSILLVFGLCCAFFIRYRVLVVTASGLTPLLGFNDLVGQALLNDIAANNAGIAGDTSLGEVSPKK
ncbi:MAG: hypothetical protein C0623_10165 [Desulfuromonas sp.]|nr:MAG: hypothetical protein C0623_10165 [Desulfuromonas sp.]